MFWDLQCPYSHASWEKFPAIKQRFEADFDFSIQVTSLLFHPQAFTAHCAASLIEGKKGAEAKLKFIDACFAHQEEYMNSAIGNARPSEVDIVFADIAERAGIFDQEQFTREAFLSKLHDWEEAVKPAYNEHKIALGYGVYGTPKHVIDEKIVVDTESSWGPDEWVEKLKSL